MRSYHAADLHLCFHKVDFLNTWQMVGNLKTGFVMMQLMCK